MKIILNYMQKSDGNENNKYIIQNNTLQLEVFLFKYLHFERKLITDADFDKARGNILDKCKFPTEAFSRLSAFAPNAYAYFWPKRRI